MLISSIRPTSASDQDQPNFDDQVCEYLCNRFGFVRGETLVFLILVGLLALGNCWLLFDPGWQHRPPWQTGIVLAAAWDAGWLVRWAYKLSYRIKAKTGCTSICSWLREEMCWRLGEGWGKFAIWCVWVLVLLLLDIRLLWKNPDVISFVFAVFVAVVVVVVVSWALGVGSKQRGDSGAALVVESAQIVTIAAPANEQLGTDEVSIVRYSRSDDDLERQ
ncbi:hypothetical protein LTR09_005088 [Extremus antarcticus]|uniref:Transmembrane protein n=1 Tax=Extremus antarcticus TaxID=702011 RepID=A0AAJ0DNT4_9PEZI|nr:hypothetical protein LTR09_005088 [Extremus antarcticus]